MQRQLIHHDYCPDYLHSCLVAFQKWITSETVVISTIYDNIVFDNFGFDYICINFDVMKNN